MEKYNKPIANPREENILSKAIWFSFDKMLFFASYYFLKYVERYLKSQNTNKNITTPSYGINSVLLYVGIQSSMYFIFLNIFLPFRKQIFQVLIGKKFEASFQETASN